VIIDLLFIACVVLIWSAIAYQLVLTVAGYVYAHRNRPARRLHDVGRRDWPSLTVLIPARNEEKVIETTVRSLLAQAYPRDRLEIIVINDGSTDHTHDCVVAMARTGANVRVIDIPAAEAGRGKSRVLNIGLAAARGDILAIYDADSAAEPTALRTLVGELLRDPKLAAAIGHIRTQNRQRNLLTRLVDLETLSFQWCMQAGKWALSRIATLPGTNYVIRRSVVESAGCWDEQALTEDLELSVRIYERGWLMKYVPWAVCYEQKPETVRVWLRQRARWVRGHNHVLARWGFRLLRPSTRRLNVLYVLAQPYLFFIALVVSDALLVMFLAGAALPTLPGLFAAAWFFGFVLFVLQMWLVAALEDHGGVASLGLAVLMYFTYAQGWLYVVGRALVQDAVLRRPKVWDKTPRFATAMTSATEDDAVRAKSERDAA
jgi:cellulose synthase/poly-beta-1,6-N-acetylglucosamine synthase-like glycosyltransferase